MYKLTILVLSFIVTIFGAIANPVSVTTETSNSIQFGPVIILQPLFIDVINVAKTANIKGQTTTNGINDINSIVTPIITVSNITVQTILNFNNSLAIITNLSGNITIICEKLIYQKDSNDLIPIVPSGTRAVGTGSIGKWSFIDAIIDETGAIIDQSGGISVVTLNSNTFTINLDSPYLNNAMAVATVYGQGSAYIVSTTQQQVVVNTTTVPLKFTIHISGLS